MDMEEKEIIKVIDETGVEKEVEVITYITLKTNNRDYVIYTENKTDASGNIEVYVSEVVAAADGSYTLNGIDDEAVWVEIKKAMLDIAKDGE